MPADPDRILPKATSISIMHDSLKFGRYYIYRKNTVVAQLDMLLNATRYGKLELNK